MSGAFRKGPRSAAALVLTALVTAVPRVSLAAPPAPADPPGTVRIIAFGAHPDDCELKAAGVAAKWAALGHKFKFVSVTNGDIGHWRMAGGPLAQRRRAGGAARRAASSASRPRSSTTTTAS